MTRGEEDDNGVPMRAAPISSRVALGANALDGAPAHCVDELNGLLAQCRATGFATAPGEHTMSHVRGDQSQREDRQRRVEETTRTHLHMSPCGLTSISPM